MPPRTRAQEDSKRGLIIALVIFVLLTLGLGVSTWFGYSEQDRYVKDAKKNADEKKVMEDDRNYYQAQARVYRGYMGLTEGMEGADSLGTYKEQLQRGPLGKNSKDNANVQNVLTSLDSSYGWNGNQPRETMESTIKTLNTKMDSMATELAKTKSNLQAANKELQKKADELQAAQKDFADKLADMEKRYKNEFAKSDQQLGEIRTSYNQQSEDRNKLKEQAAQDNKALNETIGRKNQEIASLKALAQKKQNEIDEFKVKHPEAPTSMRTDWRIVQMDDRGTHPYINLGSADHVKPQLTFTIYGVGVDGRPNSQPKGTLEVISVVGPHLSQTRITSEKDANRDPIIVRDIIYNASWNPNIKKHIAVAGIIDLTGDGRDSLMEFIRNLERQNIIVDAFEDPKDGSMKGQITYQTDYLILGATPDRAGGRQGDAEKRILEGRKLMQEEAKKYGVPVKNLISYLEMIGYALPHTIRSRGPSSRDSDYRSDIVPRLGRDKLVPSTPIRERPSGEAPPPDKK